MLITDAKLYLPLSTQLIDAALDDSKQLEEVIKTYPIPQISALFTIQYLPKLKTSQFSSPETILTKLISVGNEQVKQNGIASFLLSAIERISRSEIRIGYELLPEFGIALLSDDELTHRRYLNPDGSWDSGFRERYKKQLESHLERTYLPTGAERILTYEQSRIFREVKAQSDDHLHVQGYAGTGKSSLVRSILDMLQSLGARTLILAERRAQLDSLLLGINYTNSKTFEILCSQIIPKDLTNPIHRRMAKINYSKTTITDQEIIQKLGIRAYGDLSPIQIVQTVRSIIGSYCYSRDIEIDGKHIPNRYALFLDAAKRQIVLNYATELWKIILVPQNGLQIPVRGYHTIKWAALNNCRIPDLYTHVLIDECHDLSESVLQILDNSSQAIISLGDEYQNLQGKPKQRSGLIRKREVTHSVRSGRPIEDIVNPIIWTLPGDTKSSFNGNPLQKTEIIYYDQPRIPENPVVILVNDMWGLFEWAQRLAMENLAINLLSDSTDLNTFVTDCIELYEHEIRPRHGQLFRFTSWDSLANSQHANSGFNRIDKLLRKGYSLKHWMNTFAKLESQKNHNYSLGLVSDVRNREFKSVMLTPELIQYSHNSAEVLPVITGPSIYVAATRAEHQLLIPKDWQKWL